MAEIIEIKSVSMSPNPVEVGGKVKISVGLEVNEAMLVASIAYFLLN